MKIVIALVLAFALVQATNRALEYEQIMALVQAGNTPAQLLANKIDAHVLSVRQEQLQHDDIAQVQKGVCDEELAFRQKEIADAEYALQKAVQHKKKCTVALMLARGDIAVFSRYYTIFTEELEFIRVRREEEKVSFDRKLAAFNYALQTIEMARPIIDDWEQNQGSFIQIANHFNKMFVQATKANMVEDFLPLFSVLAETGGNELADRLRGVLNTVAEKVNIALAALIEDENQSIAEYTARRTRLINLLDLIQQLLDHLAQYIKELEKCVKTEENIIQAATSKKQRNQNMLNYALDMCSSFAEEYREASQTRSAQIETLQKLRKFVIAKADQFGSFEGEDSIESVFSGRKDLTSFVQLSAN